MSRSYKKVPIIKASSNGMKKVANRKVRKTKNFPLKGRGYRKVFQQYDVCDWSFRCTYKDYLNRANLIPKSYLKYGDNLKKDYSYADWYKTYKSK